MAKSCCSLALAATLALTACAPAPEEAPAQPPAGAPVEAPEQEFLATPFTAVQIRDEWIEGLTLVFRFRHPDREELQRWTVVAADADGVEIEYQPLDEAAQPRGQADRGRSTWTELRDHALFPAAGARRERQSRDTDLGTREGWLYTVEDRQAGTVKQLFFADELPGAPLWMETRQGEALTLGLSQISRQRPEAP